MLFSKESTKQEYYPRNIGLTSIGAHSTHSYLITGKEGKGAEAQILLVFMKHKAKVISHSCQIDQVNGEFTMSLACDLSKSDSTESDFMIYLRDIKHVTNVLSESMNRKLFDGFLFPLTIMDFERAIALRSDFVFQLQDRLEPQLAKSVLANWGKSYVLDQMKRVRERAGDGASEETISENIVGYLRSSGWGTFRWKTEGEVVQVTLQDPPTSQNGEARGNLFVTGMASGLVSAFLKKSMTMMSAYYDKDTRILSMVFADEKMISEQQEAESKRAKEEGQKSLREAKTEAQHERGEEEEKHVIEVPVMTESSRQVVVSRRMVDFDSTLDDEYDLD
ncbi:MAG: hypothetical protein JRN15_16515 [Nitrososphaerota archaeon]|nr:hypothetical protein [Nitrososphaerota archaeon]